MPTHAGIMIPGKLRLWRVPGDGSNGTKPAVYRRQPPLTGSVEHQNTWKTPSAPTGAPSWQARQKTTPRL